MPRSIYPAIPDPGNTLPTIIASLQAIQQTLNLIIVNAQNPRNDYDLTVASQIFITREYFDTHKAGTKTS